MNLLLKAVAAIQIFLFLREKLKGSEYADVLYNREQSDNRVHPEDEPSRSDVLEDTHP